MLLVGLRGALAPTLVALVCFCAVGCRQTAVQPDSNAVSQYPIRGNIVSVDAATSHIVLNHEAVPGFMGAMTMSYPLEDASALSELHPGDRIAGKLVVDKGSGGATNARLRDIIVIAQAKPDYKPAVQYHVPVEGEIVPDFRLLNQSDRTISFRQLRGKVVVMTFIYTRCPLADFCPRMSRNFAELDKALQADPALYKATHLLSVSFDPNYDTPKVLRSYGGAYTGRYVNETFEHWEFAAPSLPDLPKMEQFFAVGVTPGSGNAPLQHSLATAILDKNNRIVEFYPGNDWTVAEVLAKIKSLTA